MKISEKLIGYSAYLEGTDFLGTADVELPNLEAMTDSVSGAGIAGEVDSPVIGHYSSMTVKLNWRTIVKPIFKLAKPQAHAIDFRGSQQVFDAASGTYDEQAVKVSIRGIPKTTTLGTLAMGATTGSANELEVIYLKIEIDGRRVVEIDKYNYIAIIDGEDVLAKVRDQLGM